MAHRHLDSRAKWTSSVIDSVLTQEVTDRKAGDASLKASIEALAARVTELEASVEPNPDPEPTSSSPAFSTNFQGDAFQCQ